MLSGLVVQYLDIVECVLPCVEAGLEASTPYPLALDQIQETLGDRVLRFLPRRHRVFQTVKF
jgi:hypothetical protein